MPPCGQGDIYGDHMRRRIKDEDPYEKEYLLTKKKARGKDLLENSFQTYQLLLLTYPITLYPKVALRFFYSLPLKQKLKYIILLPFIINLVAYLADSLYSFRSEGMFYTDPTNGITRLHRGNGIDPVDLPISSQTSFAVVINTYKRPEMLKASLHHWIGKCGLSTGIDQVFVIWSELDVEPPTNENILKDMPISRSGLRAAGKKSIEEDILPDLEFIRVPKDSLNSRFLPIANLKSDALFMVDDDVIIDCASTKESFNAWRHHPNALVGFFPRLASPPRDPKNQYSTIYHTWPYVYMKHRFNIILTKASFLHKKYLDMYFDDQHNPKEVLDYVDEHFNCEDIAMAFLVARMTNSALKDSKTHGYCRDCPVFTNGSITDKGLRKGISTSGGKWNLSGHMEKRSQCMSFMKGIYESRGWDYPLYDVNLDKQSWSHHLFWWQYSPSMVWEWFSVGNILE